MANRIALPPEIILGITTIKASGIDPNDFNNAVQELYNRGYGKQGKWIQDHKELYLQALQDGFIAKGSEIPNSEPVKNVVQHTPANPGGYEASPVPNGDNGRIAPPTGAPLVNDPEIAGINPEAPVDASVEVQDTSTKEIASDVEPEDKPHKRK